MTDLLELGALARRGIEAAQLDAIAAGRAPSRDSAHALLAKGVVQLRNVMSTLQDANHAADPVAHLYLIEIMRDLGAVMARTHALEHAVSLRGSRE